MVLDCGHSGEKEKISVVSSFFGRGTYPVDGPLLLSSIDEVTRLD